ncbi:hypothetical protein TNCV_3106961 [Trichonephila clavipes]|nr:hypothetical protein TNCV_3106961 [Trichonephila clavipes]
MQAIFKPPFIVVVSDADFCAVESGVRIPEKAWMFVNSQCLAAGIYLNSRQATMPFVRFVEGKKERCSLDHSQGVIPQKLQWKRAKSHSSHS